MDLKKIVPAKPPPLAEWIKVPGRPGWWVNTRARNADGSQPKAYSPGDFPPTAPFSRRPAAPPPLGACR
jgi:hypothetical protein